MSRVGSSTYSRRRNKVKRQNNAAVDGLFEAAAQHLGHVPDEVGEVLLVHVRVLTRRAKEDVMRHP